MAIGSIVISANPVTGWESFEQTLSPTDFRKARSSWRDMGGCRKLNFETEVTDQALAIEYFINSPGRQVQTFTPDGRLDWGGMIHTVTLDTGTVTMSMSLRHIYNRVWSRRQPVGGGAVARTAVQEHAISQARFGIKDHVLNAGEMSDGSAEQYAAKELALHYWPYLTNFGWGSGKGAFLKFSAMGWFDTLGWIVYIQDVAGGEDDADVIAAAIVAECGQFISSSTFQANATQIGKKNDSDRRGDAILKSIAAVGDAADNPWVVGVDASRNFYYREAALAKLE